MKILIYDAIHFISLLTGRKLRNIIKLWVSYQLSRIVRKPIHWGMPMTIEIEPTTSCNLRCPQCISGLRDFTRDTGMLQSSMFEQVIDELHHDLVWLVLYFQGEPFLNKKFLDYIRYASQKNIYTATSSNGHYFTDEVAKQTIESGLSRLIISIDGTSQETYSKYRIGGKLDEVIAGTQRILYWKKQLGSSTPHVIWQFIVFKHNEHELPIIKKLAKEMGVDELAIKTAQVYGYENDKDFIPDNKDLSRYQRNADGSYVIKNSLDNHCWKMWRSSVITWDGWVVPCCFDKDASHKLGNVSKQTFSSVWSAKESNDFRGQVLKHRNKIAMCTNCTEGTKVWG
jgi:radical SAM protein with 4Fe4S-binding SPASM domain